MPIATESTTEHVAWAVAAVVVAFVASGILDRVLRRRERALIERFPHNYAAIKTRFRVLERVTIALVVAIAGLTVLQDFEAGRRIAQTVLASGAVLALIVGLAIRTPLANLGAGLQLAFTQPFRIGDRITVGTETGVVEQIRLSYTVLRTDDQRRVFLPNESLVGQAISNATIADEARTLAVTVPVAPDADLARVRALLAEESEGAPGLLEGTAPVVRVTDVAPAAVTVQVAVTVEPGADVDELGSLLRERAAMRLAAEGLAAGVPAGG